MLNSGTCTPAITSTIQLLNGTISSLGFQGPITSPPDMLTEIADDVPDEWFGKCARADLADLCETVYQRRFRVRDLITDFRRSSRQPFPSRTSPFAVSNSSRSNPCKLAAA